MSKRKLKKVQRSYASGSPDKRLAAARAAAVTLEQDRVRLLDSLDQQRDQYTRTREAWESRRIPGALRPLAIQQDVRDGRFYTIVGWVLAIAELALFWFFAAMLGVNPLFSLILATVLTWGLKAALLAIWRYPAQPLETKRRLQKFVLVPSLLLLLLAGGVLLFARAASGALALLLLDGINISLFVLSLGCLGLAAGLFGLGYLLMWSRRAQVTYEKTEDALAYTVREGKAVEDILIALDNEDIDTSVALPGHSQALAAESGALPS